MNPQRYVSNKLQERYNEPPGDFVFEGELPAEDLELREALAAMKVAAIKLSSFGIWARIFSSEPYRHGKEIVRGVQTHVVSLVNQSDVHRAALMRIIEAMPRNNGFREQFPNYAALTQLRVATK